MNTDASYLFDRMGQLSQRIKGKQGTDRIRSGLAALKDFGLVENPRDRYQLGSALKALPGPFGSSEASDSELVGFFDYAASFDPVGVHGGRYNGIFDHDPRRDEDQGRENCDLYSIAAADTAAGATGANVTLANTALDTEYYNAVLWLYTGVGKVRNVVTISVDGRPFFLGPAASMPADIADVTLEPHPMRQGIYLGNLNRSLSVTAFLETSATAVHWELLLDAETKNGGTQRPNQRVMRRGRSPLVDRI